MHRIAPLLLIVGLLLLVTSLRVPASPVGAGTVAAPVAYFDDQASAVLIAVDAEAARLRERLDHTPDAPVASRDPFRFGDQPEVVPVLPPVDEAERDVPAAPVRTLVLPRVVAITSGADGETSPRRAFVALGGNVIEVAPGTAVGEFVVETVGVTMVELRHRALGTTHVIRLR